MSLSRGAIDWSTMCVIWHFLVILTYFYDQECRLSQNMNDKAHSFILFDFILFRVYRKTRLSIVYAEFII